jgi:hypothetical protein
MPPPGKNNSRRHNAYPSARPTMPWRGNLTRRTDPSWQPPRRRISASTRRNWVCPKLKAVVAIHPVLSRSGSCCGSPPVHQIGGHPSALESRTLSFEGCRTSAAANICRLRGRIWPGFGPGRPALHCCGLAYQIVPHDVSGPCGTGISPKALVPVSESFR